MNEQKKQRRGAIKPAIAPDALSHKSGQADSYPLEPTHSADAGDLRNSLDSSHVTPIRLARRPVLSLDAEIHPDDDESYSLFDIVGDHEAQLSSPTIDWKTALKDARLSKLERMAIEEARKGTPEYRLHEALNCKPKAASRALASALQKVESSLDSEHVSLPPVSHSRRLVYRERLPSGHRRPALSPIVLTPVFQQVMEAEKYSGLLSQRDPRSFQKKRPVLRRTIRRVFFMVIEINEDVARAEVQRMIAEGWARWQSLEWIEDHVHGRMRKTALEQRERDESARIAALSDQDRLKEIQSVENNRRLAHLRTGVAKDRLSERQNAFSKRAAGTSGTKERVTIDEAKQEVARCEEVERDLTLQLRMLREQDAYCRKIAVQNAVATAQEKIEADLKRDLLKQAQKIYKAHPMIGTVNAGKLFTDVKDRNRRAGMIEIVRLLAAIGGIHTAQEAA